MPTASLSWNTSPARIDSTIAGVPPSSRCDRVVEVAVLGRVDVRDRAAAGHGRAPGWRSSSRRTPSTPGVPGPPMNLCGREEHRVLVAPRLAGRAPHLDVDVRRGRGEVPERQRAVPVQQRGDRRRVGDDAGDVATRPRTSRSAAAGRRGREQLALERRRRRCGRRASSRIATTSAIDSRHGSSLEWCSNGPMNTTGRSSAGSRRELVAVLEVGGMRRPRMPISLSIAAGRARSRRRSPRSSSSPPTASRMIRPGVLAQPGGLQAGAAGLGVGVGVARAAPRRG